MGGAAPVEQGDERPLLRQPVALQTESLAFVLLNLCDLVVTSLVFRWGGYETNLLAAYVLRYYGVEGLAIYKFALTAGVVVACQVVWHKYPRLARAILVAGCAIYTYVVIVTTLRLYAHTGYLPLPW